MTPDLARRRLLALGLAGFAAAAAPFGPARAETTHFGPSGAEPVDTVKALYGRPQSFADTPFLSARLRRLFAA
ncbi:hypothetical protein, partial [Escherichia coli]|uniref:hypothetical protein n=1 Tax=Escherichia coli TaxID=562 RepID=UPI0013D03032